MKVLSLASLSNTWGFHGYQEATLLRALALRGATVDYYGCDALSGICAVTPVERSRKEQEAFCRRCFRRGSARAAEAGLSLRSLCTQVSAGDRDCARTWAASLTPEMFSRAVYGLWALGDWVVGTVLSQFRLASYEPGNPDVDAAFRRYLEGGLLWALTLERLLDREAYDRIVLFNGRHSNERISREIAGMRGIPFYTHEAGWVPETIIMARNTATGATSRLSELVRDWEDVPLTRDEIEEIVLYQFQREWGSQTSVGGTAFASLNFDSDADLYRKLGIAPETSVWAVFPSSTDELSADPEFAKVHPPGEQNAWILRVLDEAARYPHVHVVLRVHPNMARGGLYTREAREDIAFYQSLKESGRERLTVIDAEDPFSTYGLMKIADVGLSYASTCSLEMGLHGKQNCYGSRLFLSEFRGTEVLTTRESIAEAFARYALIPKGFRSAAFQRPAFRLLYTLRNLWGFPFPFVAMPNARSARLAWREPGELAPNRDPVLDFLCEAVLTNAPPRRLPGPAEQARTREDEDRIWSQPLDIEREGLRLVLERGTYALPPDGVIRLTSRGGNGQTYVLGGWRKPRAGYRALQRSTARLAFQAGDGKPVSGITVDCFARAGVEVEVTLNGHSLTRFPGTGGIVRVCLPVSDGILAGLNVLAFEARPNAGSVKDMGPRGLSLGVLRLAFSQPGREAVLPSMASTRLRFAPLLAALKLARRL
ncbi:hypothetical protein IHV25_06645 [Phaeovibrio sulfidiphilus]|uniref:Capsule polysaccharide biosynthesis protein n=1 Tax=Phaeovibrio sulfidiphilus TaxID=1220600 RepID=A0A8J7CCL6_9PROT|nr:hypothetical protein [Phaeovibrio sulfidiphilus]MBE1237323.1 hypothetical protein [Phaeovibrio sulfidiphilus]